MRLALLFIFCILLIINVVYFSYQGVLNYIVTKAASRDVIQKNIEEWKQIIEKDPVFRDACSWYFSPTIASDTLNNKDVQSEEYVLGKIETEYWKNKYIANKSYVMSAEERQALHEVLLKRYFELTGKSSGK